MDAAERLAYLAFSDPAMRPMETNKRGNGGGTKQGENYLQQHNTTPLSHITTQHNITTQYTLPLSIRHCRILRLAIVLNCQHIFWLTYYVTAINLFPSLSLIPSPGTPSKLRNFTLRHYDAVGPETLTIRDLLERFALYR